MKQSLLTNYEVNRVVETRHFLIVLVLINLDDRIRNSRSRRIKIKDYDTGISYFSGITVLIFESGQMENFRFLVREFHLRDRYYFFSIRKAQDTFQN